MSIIPINYRHQLKQEAASKGCTLHDDNTITRNSDHSVIAVVTGFSVTFDAKEKKNRVNVELTYRGHKENAEIFV